MALSFESTFNIQLKDYMKQSANLAKKIYVQQQLVDEVTYKIASTNDKNRNSLQNYIANVSPVAEQQFPAGIAGTLEFGQARPIRLNVDINDPSAVAAYTGGGRWIPTFENFVISHPGYVKYKSFYDTIEAMMENNWSMQVDLKEKQGILDGFLNYKAALENTIRNFLAQASAYESLKNQIPPIEAFFDKSQAESEVQAQVKAPVVEKSNKGLLLALAALAGLALTGKKA